MDEARREKVSLTCCNPPFAGRGLTLRAVAVLQLQRVRRTRSRVEVAFGEMEVDGSHFRICPEGRADDCRRRAEPIFFCGTPCTSWPQSFQKNLFTPLEISASTTKKLKKPGFPIRYYHGSCFFGMWTHHRPGRAHCLSGHLTEKLDYELELGVFLKKSGEHFSAIIPCTAKHPLGCPR